MNWFSYAVFYYNSVWTSQPQFGIGWREQNSLLSVSLLLFVWKTDNFVPVSGKKSHNGCWMAGNIKLWSPIKFENEFLGWRYTVSMWQQAWKRLCVHLYICKFSQSNQAQRANQNAMSFCGQLLFMQMMPYIIISTISKTVKGM